MTTIFLLLRNRVVRVFNPRASVASLNCELASRKYSCLGWVSGIWCVSDEELFEQCGLDAIAFIRFLHLGFNICLVACLNSIYLMPTYSSAKLTDENRNMTDVLDKVSIAHMSKGDNGMYATVFSCYIVYLSLIWLLDREYKWYKDIRIRFMSRKIEKNFTVFVGGLPPELRYESLLRIFTL